MNSFLGTDRSDVGRSGRNGTLTAEMRRRFQDASLVYVEEQLLHGETKGLIHAVGADYKATDQWTFGASAEGHVRVSVTVSDEELQEGCLRIADFLETL